MLTSMASDTDHEMWQEARQRITSRFGGQPAEGPVGRSWCLGPMAAVEAVAAAIEFEQPVDADDVRAGLRLARRACVGYIVAEVDLIRRAREIGFTWDEIGALLGVGDRRAAQQRYVRLQAGFNDPVGDPSD